MWELVKPLSRLSLARLWKTAQAVEVGLKEGDKILSIDRISINDFNAMRAIIFENPNREPLFEIDRRGDNITSAGNSKSAYSKQYDLHYGVLGVRSSSAGEFRKLGVAEALYIASIDTVNLCAAMLRGIGRQLVSGQASSGEQAGQYELLNYLLMPRNRDWLPSLLFTALISINLGLINLFPIPVLDGGHLVFFLDRGGYRQAFARGVQDKLNRVGVSSYYYP